MSKAHMLRNLKLRKVDFVDQGANQLAHIRLAKRKEEDPIDDPETSPEERAFFERFGAFFAKMFHATPVAKGDAMTFDQVTETRDTRNAIYRISDSMCESIHAIINDKDLDDAQKAEMIKQTADQVADAIKEDIAAVFGSPVQKSETGEGEGQPVPEDGNPEPPTEPTAGNSNPTNDPIQQEGETNMNLDTSKMTPEDKATYEELAKRYATEPAAPETPAAPAEPTAQQPEADDVFKGLHPTVKAELESLRKFREESEMRELTEVAKKYTLLGKKPEELAPVLKSLRDAGGSAYNDMISILDSNLEAVEKSGVFAELGKRGTAPTDDPWGKIEAAAQEIMKSNTNMRWPDAVDAACMKHPELVAAYEKSRK